MVKTCELCKAPHKNRNDNLCKGCREKMRCVKCKKICHNMEYNICPECSQQYCGYGKKCPDISGRKCVDCRERCIFCSEMMYGTNGCDQCHKIRCMFCGKKEKETKDNLCTSCRMSGCDCNNDMHALCRLCEIEKTILSRGKYTNMTIGECFEKDRDYVQVRYQDRKNPNYEDDYKLLVAYYIYRVPQRI